MADGAERAQRSGPIAVDDLIPFASRWRVRPGGREGRRAEFKFLSKSRVRRHRAGFDSLVTAELAISGRSVIAIGEEATPSTRRQKRTEASPERSRKCRGGSLRRAAAARPSESPGLASASRDSSAEGLSGTFAAGGRKHAASTRSRNKPKVSVPGSWETGRRGAETGSSPFQPNPMAGSFRNVTLKHMGRVLPFDIF